MHRRSYARVDLGNLAKNFQTLRGLLPEGSFVCPMVKANAYGHGDVEVSRRLEKEGAKQLGVALVEEGIKLRKAGIKIPILVFSLFEDFSVPVMLENNLTPVASQWSQLEKLNELVKKPIDLHIKFNTGMTRLGFAVSDASKLREWFEANPKLKLKGVSTHLLRGDDAGIPGGDSESQLIRLEEAAKAFSGMNVIVHALNSSGAVTMHARLKNKKAMAKGVQWPMGARFGIALYGGIPSSLETNDVQLKPVMSLRSHIALTHKIPAGEKVSYNAIWKATRPSVIGVVPMGYADGFPRIYSNNAEVLCRGKRVPVVGTVCMDYFMVDLTDIVGADIAGASPELVGEEVVLFGSQGSDTISAEELAKRASTISYEVFTRISDRVPRQYVG
jgi:alanine racemase